MTALPSPFTETRVAQSRQDTALVAVVAGMLGAGLGAATPWLVGWMLSLPWIPFGGPLRLLAALSDQVPWWALVAGGLVLGVVAGLLLVAAEPVVTVSDRAVLITTGKQRTRVARSQVTVAAVEDRHLVLRDHDDVELAHHKLDAGPAARVADALHRHGWSR